MLPYRDLNNPDNKEECNAFAVNLCEHAKKTAFFTYQHVLHGLKQPKIKEILKNPRFKRIEFTFDCANQYTSEEMLYNLTKEFAQNMLPRRYDSVRQSPQCHSHGKSNLDRRFTSLTTWKTNWENDLFHDTITTMKELQSCYESGRDISNKARVTVDHEEPIITEISCIELKEDLKTHRPYVKLKGMKASNAVSLITTDIDTSQWELYNNVLPHLSENRGEDITNKIIEGEDAKPVTAKMAKPGAKRQQIKIEKLESDPGVVESQHNFRQRFIERGNLRAILRSKAIDI